MGLSSVAEFVEFAFTKRLGEGVKFSLAAALFGGQTMDGQVFHLSEVADFDAVTYRFIVQGLQHGLEKETLFGMVLAAAISASTFEGESSPCIEFERACNGLSASTATREAGLLPLRAIVGLAADVMEPGILHRKLGTACDVSAELFCLHAHVWKASRMSLASSILRLVDHWNVGTDLHLMPIPLLQGFIGSTRGDQLMKCLERVKAVPVHSISICVLKAAKFLAIPNLRLFGEELIILLQVTLSILGYSEPLETEQQLEALFRAHPKLHDALSGATWYESDGRTLRKEFREFRPKSMSLGAKK